MNVVSAQSLWPASIARPLRLGLHRLGAGLLCLILAGQAALAGPRKIDDYHWQNVDRIVAIGDVHGDHANLLATLKSAGVVDARGHWSAGKTHLVQLGDIPDRGPDTRRIIALLQALQRQARRQGGEVHTLLGNHEAMNTYGDLRYVSAGEFAAFVDRDSPKWRDRYYENVLADLKLREPVRFATLPNDFRQAWDAAHPLGWVEHQRAWNPKWNPQGEYFLWAMQDKVAIQINNLIFLHGGISAAYCRNSLASLTEKARAALRAGDPATTSVLTDPLGPLWYRGLAGVAPEASVETVEAILDQHKARHIVVGHTPTAGAIWPSYAGRVIQVDTGLSAHYGGHLAWLEVTRKGMFAGYKSEKLALPSDDGGRIGYLRQVIALQPENRELTGQLSALQAAAPAPTDDADAGMDLQTARNPSATEAAVAAPTICDISP